MLSQNVDKMFTYLKGFCAGAGMGESLHALGYMREKHDGQIRNDGQPYIVHPLGMACYAVALGVRDDNTIATFLLHDVCEDCGVDVDYLPFNDVIRKGVKYMTIGEFPGEQKLEKKRRYYNELLESPESILCKAGDRFYNLTTMEGVKSESSIIKNIVETHCMLLPMLKIAKDKWPRLSDVLYVYRTNIKSINNTLAHAHGVTLNEDGTADPTIEFVLSEDYGQQSEEPAKE
ncbi:HD domain-containing protein [Candidatus Saccharibacteria bacterium]|nr:HD domain-containing protein [Candidatus Saccharibacteria bacterium]MBR3233955.1 HD domain-containing protein [Candidatus Saccharibacteria bacterium]